MQGLLLVANVLLVVALGLSVPVGALAGIVVIATVAAVIPLSINGLGFREGAYVWSFAAYGVGHNRGLAFALLMLGLVIATSAVGGIVYMLGGARVDSPRTSPSEARR